MECSIKFSFSCYFNFTALFDLELICLVAKRGLKKTDLENKIQIDNFVNTEVLITVIIFLDFQPENEIRVRGNEWFLSWNLYPAKRIQQTIII